MFKLIFLLYVLGMFELVVLTFIPEFYQKIKEKKLKYVILIPVYLANTINNVIVNIILFIISVKNKRGKEFIEEFKRDWKEKLFHLPDFI